MPGDSHSWCWPFLVAVIPGASTPGDGLSWFWPLLVLTSSGDSHFWWCLLLVTVTAGDGHFVCRNCRLCKWSWVVRLLLVPTCVLVLNQGCSPVYHDHTPGPPERSSSVLSSSDSHASGGCGECSCPHPFMSLSQGVPVHTSLACDGAVMVGPWCPDGTWTWGWLASS